MKGIDKMGLLEVAYQMREKVLDTMIANLREDGLVECKFCNSRAVVKNGLRKGVQYWLCTNCGCGFVDNRALPRMRYPKDIVAKAVYDYYNGQSLNSIARGIGQQTDNHPSDSSVYTWVQKLTKIAIKEASKYIPEVGDSWVADETVLKIGGKNIWMYDIIDEKTRYLLASRLALSRTTRDAQILMESASKRAGGKIPKVILTDKNASYIDGIELAFGSDAEHVQTKPFKHEENTELIERFHGTLKDRTKVMRGLKTIDSAIEYINGWLFYYNFLRPHESLENKTPAEVAKIKYPYKSWQEIIATQEPSFDIKEPKRTPKEILETPIRAYRKRPKPKKKRVFKSDVISVVRKVK